MKILAFDPGETTGWAVVEVGEEEHISYHGGIARTHEEVWYTLENEMDHDTLLVFESFHLYANRARAQVNSSFYTVEMIGVINLWGELHNISCKQQTAQYGKSIWTDDKLKKFDLWPTGKYARHTRDALRHALTATKLHRLKHIRERWHD